MTPGQRAYEGYLARAALISVAPLFSSLGQEVQEAWEAAAEASAPPHAHRELNGVTADHCSLGHQGGAHTALRFVWHHILPQVCGGKSRTDNLAELCDNCHYSVHKIMWDLANGKPVPTGADEGQTELAERGYTLAVQAGTQHMIPKEAAG